MSHSRLSSYVPSILLAVQDDAFEFLLTFEDGEISLGLVAVAESDLVELERLGLGFAFNLDEPFGVCLIPGDALYAAVEADVLEEVKMSGVILKILLELVLIQVYWIF
jgi:hypothetical protein